MRILVSGGSGYIGGRLAQHLHNEGHDVLIGTRRNDTVTKWLPQATTIQTLWQDSDALEQACRGIEVVVHAAGINAQDSSADPVGALEFNGCATARFFHAADRAGVRRFIYLSTAHVYANPLVGLITENTCPTNLHTYATSHLAGENAVLGNTRTGSIEGLVLRLSNVFGAPAHAKVNCWQLLLNDLCRQAVRDRKMVLHSAGLQERDFIAMNEVCRVIGMLATFEPISLPHRTFNLGTGSSRTVLAMATILQQHIRSRMAFTPDLLYPAAKESAASPRLEYRPARLEALGVKVSTEFDSELDELLSFCVKHC